MSQKAKSFSPVLPNPGDAWNLLGPSWSAQKFPKCLSLCSYMLLGAPDWAVGTDSCSRAPVMKSSGGEVPGAAALYSFLFNLVVQLADEIPSPSVVPTPTLQFVLLQLSVGLCWKWDF